MNLLNYMVSPIAGAVIGYFTNWLAIKMIFLPYREKFILGKKLPFTPGLIPKERGRLAYKIGEVAQEYILTNETLKNYMSSDENKEKICNFCTNYINDVIKKNLNIDEVLEIFLKENKENVICEFKKIVTNKTNELLNDENIENNVIEFISEKIIFILKNSNLMLKNKSLFENIESFLTEKGTEFIFSEDFKNFINDKLNDKKICDFISQENIKKIKEIVNEKIPFISQWIINYINQNEAVDNKLRKLTSTVIEENVGKIAGLFINGDKIYESIKSGLIKYLSSEENQVIITVKIFDFLDNMSQKEVKEVIDKIPLNIKNILIKNVNKETISNLVNNFLEYIKNKLNNSDFNLYNFIVKIIPNFEFKLKDYIKNICIKFIKVDIINHTETFINKIIEKIINFKINYFLNKIYYTKNINDKIIVILNALINKGAMAISNNLNISKIVEDKINSFEIEVAEEIIISVIKKELNVITYVGGVLGFIIGIFPVLVQFIG